MMLANSFIKMRPRDSCSPKNYLIQRLRTTASLLTCVLKVCNHGLRCITVATVLYLSQIITQLSRHDLVIILEVNAFVLSIEAATGDVL